MTVFTLPDHLAQDVVRPGRLKSFFRRAAERTPSAAAPVSANAAAWKEFLAALDGIDDEPLGEMPPRCAVRRELPQ